MAYNRNTCGNNDVDNELRKIESTISTLDKAIANVPSGISITSGAGAPTSTPTAIGAIYIDTSSGAIYIASGTSGSYNWGYVGSGALSADYRDNLLTCYDASNGPTPTTNGGTLTGWNDLGSKTNTLSVVSGTPKYYESIQNGLPAIYFDGSSHMTGSNLADTAQPCTSFIVFKGTNWGTGAEQYICQMEAYCYSFIKLNAATTLSTCGGSAVITADSLSNNVCYLGTLISNGASSSLQVNQNTASTGNPGNSANSNYPAIASASGGGSKYTGYVMEWRVYAGLLTAEQIQQVQSFLNNKWGIY